jgi:hypothetical protein
MSNFCDELKWLKSLMARGLTFFSASIMALIAALLLEIK